LDFGVTVFGGTGTFETVDIRKLLDVEYARLTGLLEIQTTFQRTRVMGHWR
jgi:hypothetical protein